MTDMIDTTEFITNKGYEAKLVPARCRQGRCCKVMIKQEDGWRPVLSMINTGNTPHSVLVDRIKTHY